MTPSERLEDVIRGVRAATRAETDERIMAAGDAAIAKRNEQHSARVCASGLTRRTIMKNTWAKLATAAAVVAATALGMYALTGSVDGTSITMAQIRQAMQDIDWMQLDNEIPEKEGTQWAWFSFASSVEIVCDPEGRIIYSNFNTGKKLVWTPGSQDIYESDIDQRSQFLGGVHGPFEFIAKLFSFFTAQEGWKVTKQLGTYQGQKVEIWSAGRTREDASPARTEITKVYIDLEKKLPLGFTEASTGPDGKIQRLRNGRFKYPETGPADIYEAGAPKSAQIKPSVER